MLGLGAAPGLILAVGMVLLPESPRWLAGHGRIEDARRALEMVASPRVRELLPSRKEWRDSTMPIARGTLLMLQPVWRGGLEWGFFLTLACTVLEIVTGHLLPGEESA